MEEDNATQPVNIEEIIEQYFYLEGVEESLEDSTLQRVMILSSLKKLQPLQRSIIVLHYYAGYSIQEVRKKLNISESTMTRQMSSALTLMAIYLQ